MRKPFQPLGELGLVTVALLAAFVGIASASTTADVAITVRLAAAPPENRPPVALTTGPYSAGVGQNVLLCGSPSFDPDPGDFIASWEWDLDDDGVFESSGVTVNVAFNSVGTYIVRLRVSDSRGACDVVATTVSVVDLYAVEYRYTSVRPIDRYVVEYGLSAKFSNRSSGPVLNVRVTLSGAPPAYSIVAGSAFLGDIPAGEDRWSPEGQVVIRQDRRIPVVPGDQFMWTVEYDDADGVHHVVTEVTQTR